jgi:hypothetical protein
MVVRGVRDLVEQSGGHLDLDAGVVLGCAVPDQGNVVQKLADQDEAAGTALVLRWLLSLGFCETALVQIADFVSDPTGQCEPLPLDGCDVFGVQLTYTFVARVLPRVSLRRASWADSRGQID